MSKINTDKLSSATIGRRCPKSSKNLRGYTHISCIPGDEVCVIYLGGSGSISDDIASGYAKIIEKEVLKKLKIDIPVYGAKYKFFNDDVEQSLSYHIEYIKHHNDVLLNNHRIEETLSSATSEDFEPQYLDDLYNAIIRPRLTSDNEQEKLSVDTLCQRIRKMTFVAHCHGSYIALKLEERMQQQLKEMGYNAQERRKIQSQMLVIAHSPVCPLGVSNSQFVSFHSIYDFEATKPFNLLNNYINNRISEERRRFSAEQQNDTPNIENNRWFDFEPCYFPHRQGNLFLIKQKFEWDKKDGPFTSNSDEHTQVHYALCDKQTEDSVLLTYFSRNILANGILNSLKQDDAFTPLPPIDKLILSSHPQKHKQERQLFLKMYNNGKKFRTEVCTHAINRLKSIHSNTRKL